MMPHPAPFPAGSIPVLLVDDHQLVLEGVQVLLRRLPDVCVVASANSGAQALERLREHPDVLVALLDLNMPQMSGVQLMRAIREAYPQVRMLALSMFHDHLSVQEVLAAGGAGYLLKSTTEEELGVAIRRAAAGKTYFAAEVSATLLDNLNIPATRQSGNHRPLLTTREQEVLQLIAAEHTNADMAAKLYISERTVETHRKNIFTKTGAKSVVGLIQFALRHNLIRT